MATRKAKKQKGAAKPRRRTASPRRAVSGPLRISRGPQPRSVQPASSDDLAKRLAELQKSIEILLQTVERLETIPPGELAQLDLDKRKARVHAMSDAFLAIEDLENAK